MAPIWTHPDEEAEEGQQLDHQDFVGFTYGLHSSPSSSVVRQPKHMQQEYMLHLLQCAISRIQMFGSGQDLHNISDENFLSAIKTFLLNPSQFVSGKIRHQWFSVFRLTSKAATILQWIEHVVSFGFVHPFSEEQQRHSRFSERLLGLLSKTVGAESVNALLDCDAPGQVHFANRVSCTYHSDFVRQQRDELLASGALVEWDSVSVVQPQTGNGLGVVKNHKGKLRMILDCRHLNLYLPYEHFKYEQLSDTVEYLQPND